MLFPMAGVLNTYFSCRPHPILNSDKTRRLVGLSFPHLLATSTKSLYISQSLLRAIFTAHSSLETSYSRWFDGLSFPYLLANISPELPEDYCCKLQL